MVQSQAADSFKSVKEPLSNLAVLRGEQRGFRAIVVRSFLDKANDFSGLLPEWRGMMP